MRYFGGYKKAPEWLETQWLLSLFGSNLKKSKTAYRKFVEDVRSENLENPAKDMIAGSILGNDDFVKWIKKNFLKSDTGFKEKQQLRELKTGPIPEDIVQVTSRQFSCDRDRIIQKGGKRNIARDVAIYLSRKMTAEKGVELGRYFGGISG